MALPGPSESSANVEETEDESLQLALPGLEHLGALHLLFVSCEALLRDHGGESADQVGWQLQQLGLIHGSQLPQALQGRRFMAI